MKKNKVTADIKFGLHGRFANMKLDDWQQKADKWTITLKYKGRRMTTPYFTGPLYESEPRVDDILRSLFLDAFATEVDFNDWCGEFGYDPEDKKAKKVYLSCKRSGERLKKLLGEDFEEIQEEVRK